MNTVITKPIPSHIGQTKMKFELDYKMLYLVGTKQDGSQTLFTFRYRTTTIPMIQLVHKAYSMTMEQTTVYSDIEIEHSDKYISGGVPTFLKCDPSFIYNRETLELKFFSNDEQMNCVILPDTAMRFIELIARM